MFGWFSKTQASAIGFVTYKSVSGKTVRVSEVTDDHRQPLKYSDMEYVGEVVELVSNCLIAGVYEELTEQDIIAEKALIITDVRHQNAKQDWASVFAKQVNVRGLFGPSIPVVGKRQQYYGAD
jgi:hypothetical protein